MKTLVAIAALLLAAPGLAGEPGPAGPAAVAPGVVDVQTARSLAAAGIRILDVRTPAEFAAGHVPGAANLPHDEIERRLAELGPPSTPLLIYCRSGNRSGIAGRILRAHGFDKVYDFQRYDLWVASEKHDPPRP